MQGMQKQKIKNRRTGNEIVMEGGKRQRGITRINRNIEMKSEGNKDNQQPRSPYP